MKYRTLRYSLSALDRWRSMISALRLADSNDRDIREDWKYIQESYEELSSIIREIEDAPTQSVSIRVDKELPSLSQMITEDLS